MLCDCSDNVVALCAISVGHAFDCEIVAFGCAGSEYNLLRRSADQFCDLFTSGVYRLAGLPSEGMAVAGGIAEFAREVRQHGLKHLRVKWRGGVVIEVRSEERRV